MYLCGDCRKDIDVVLAAQELTLKIEKLIARIHDHVGIGIGRELSCDPCWNYYNPNPDPDPREQERLEQDRYERAIRLVVEFGKAHGCDMDREIREQEQSKMEVGGVIDLARSLQLWYPVRTAFWYPKYSSSFQSIEWVRTTSKNLRFRVLGFDRKSVHPLTVEFNRLVRKFREYK